MIGKLDEALKFQSTALTLRASRQQVLASNIANADTPGYKAADFDFARALANATGAAKSGASASTLKTTAAGHLAGSRGPGGADIQYRVPGQASIDGNSVELDAERAAFADNAIRYEASLRFLNGQIKTIMSAISG
jgi:flagellar basal-body rod protein FlgB